MTQKIHSNEDNPVGLAIQGETPLFELPIDRFPHTERMNQAQNHTLIAEYSQK